MNDEEWQKLRKKAKNIALDKYTDEASSIIRLTKDEISDIIKEASVDKKKLSDLISIVNDATKQNSQKAETIRNTVGLVEVAVPLIKKIVL